MSSLLHTTIGYFGRRYGREPSGAARAPGRVEVIGNHTDYNGGMVIGAGIDRDIVAIGAAREDRLVRLATGSGGRIVEVSLDDLSRQSDEARWANYPIGVLVMLQREGIAFERGFDVQFESRVPTGAGLSSSAALELAMAELVLSLTNQSLDPVTLVRACRRAENEFVGVPTGILDQGVSKFSRINCVVSIDCRVETFTAVPLPLNSHFWIFNSHHKHALVGSLYAARHRECMQALAALKHSYPELEHLTDAAPEQIDAARDVLPDQLYRRAWHVSSEHRRVKRALDALARNEREELGGLLFASHESSRDFFENSTPELDFLVEELARQEHVIGARLTGGGFGGAVLALTTKAFDHAGADEVAAAYRERFGSDVTIEHCLTTEGAGPINMDGA